jgi:hypothetical protein
MADVIYFFVVVPDRWFPMQPMQRRIAMLTGKVALGEPWGIISRELGNNINSINYYCPSMPKQTIMYA